MREGIERPRGVRQEYPGWAKFAPGTTIGEQATGGTRSSYDLGNGRQLVVDDRLLELICEEDGGSYTVRLLCRLSGLAPDRCRVIANDRRRLLVSISRYLVCVDMRKFPPPLAGPQTQPATPTRGREPEDAADSIKEF